MVINYAIKWIEAGAGGRPQPGWPSVGRPERQRSLVLLVASMSSVCWHRPALY